MSLKSGISLVLVPPIGFPLSQSVTPSLSPGFWS